MWQVYENAHIKLNNVIIIKNENEKRKRWIDNEAIKN
jgi:hypothetical protein